MNNGNFGGFNPNGNGQNNQSGFMGGYDPNAQNNGYNPNNGYNNGYQVNNGYNNGYQANNGYNNGYNAPAPNNGYNGAPSNGYPPYQGGTYSNPANNGYPAQGGNYSSYAPQAPAPQGGTQQTSVQNQSQGFAFPIGSTSSTGVMSLSDYSKRIFLWMGAGLALTFFVALGLMLYLTSGSELSMYQKFVKFVPMFYIGLIAEVVLAIVLGIFVKKMPYKVSLTMFIVYSIVSGVTLTPLLVVYDAGSAIFAFAAAAVLFISFAIYGIVTKRDLLKLGPILMIGLIVLLLFSVLGVIFHMSGMSILVSIIGIIIFIGLTAYDTQKIKASYAQYENDPVMLKKVSVNLALQLYLDFINLFIYILRLMGKARR